MGELCWAVLHPIEEGSPRRALGHDELLGAAARSAERFSAGGCPGVWRALPVVPPGLCDTVTARRVRVSADRGVRGAVKIR